MFPPKPNPAKTVVAPNRRLVANGPVFLVTAVGTRHGITCPERVSAGSQIDKN